MTDVGFHRPDGAVTAQSRPGAESLGQRVDFDRIAQWRAGAVGLDIADVFGVDARPRLRFENDGRLSAETGRGEANLVGTVVVDGRTPDYGDYRIAIFHCLRQALQHHQTDPAADDSAFGLGIEGAAMPVRGQDHAFLIAVAHALRQIQANSAGQCDIAFKIQQALAGHMHGNQRRGTSGLHRDRRAFQVQLVSRVGGDEIPVVQGVQAVSPDRRRQGLPARVEMLRTVLAFPRPGINADQRRAGGRRVACLFQRLVGAFQKQALLRIGYLRVQWAHVKERRVERLNARHHQTGFDVIGVGQQCRINAGRQQFFVTEALHRVAPTVQQCPKSLHIGSLREPARQSDDSDAGKTMGFPQTQLLRSRARRGRH